MILLVAIALPAIALLFLQNNQFQTLISRYMLAKYSEKIEMEISLEAVKYSFFKRLHASDLLIEDVNGDTLIYAERAHLRIKRFRPDKKNIHIKSLTLEGGEVHITGNADSTNTLQLFADAVKRGLDPLDKPILKIDEIHLNNGRFSQRQPFRQDDNGGIDFTDLDVQEMQVNIKDFQFKWDTITMQIGQSSAVEKSGFQMDEIDFKLEFSPTRMIFQEASIVTPLSGIYSPEITFEYSNPKNFQHLFDSITMHIESKASNVDFIDLAYLFPEVEPLTGKIDVTGELHGRFSDMGSSLLKINYGDSTRFEGGLAIRGLPFPDSLKMRFDISELTTTPKELAELTSRFDTAFKKQVGLVEKFKRFTLEGYFDGGTSGFSTAGKLISNNGTAQFGMEYAKDLSGKVGFDGKIQFDSLNLAKLIPLDDPPGETEFDIEVSGTTRDGKLETTIDGIIHSLVYRNYDYRNIQISGLYRDRNYEGDITISDPNIDLNFNGKIDLSVPENRYDFLVNVTRLRPYYLNLNRDDPEYFASFFLRTDLTGSSIDSLNGDVQLVNSFLKRTGGQVQIYDILATATNQKDSSSISLRSELLDIDLKGHYRLSQLPSMFQYIVNEHVRLFGTTNYIPISNEYYEVEVELKDASPLLEFFYPDYSIAKNSILKGSGGIINDQFLLSLEGAFDQVGFRDYRWNDLALHFDLDSLDARLNLRGDNLQFDENLSISSPDLTAYFYNDTSNIDISWDNGSRPFYKGRLDVEGWLVEDLDKNLGYRIRLNPSSFTLKGEPFKITPAEFEIFQNHFRVENFKVAGADQAIHVNGTYGIVGELPMAFNLENFDLQLINQAFRDLLFQFKGRLSGAGSITEKRYSPVLTTSLRADNLSINDQNIGQLDLQLEWINDRQMLQVDLETINSGQNAISASGSYIPVDGSLNFDTRISRLQLISLQPYLSKFAGELEGEADLFLGLNGTLDKPLLNGSITLRDAKAKVLATNGVYQFNNDLRIYNNNLFFNDFKLIDPYSNQLLVNGNITTTWLKEPKLNLELEADNFNFLSTTRFDSDAFYGDIFASAVGTVKGSMDQITIAASAETEKFTNVKLPLYNADEVRASDFITFIRSEEITDLPPEEDEPRSSPILLDLDLDITPEATVQLIFDPKVGDIIEASGDGAINFELDNAGDFKMFGDVNIQDGQYLFTLQNVINKRFRVKPGGSISWNGSPLSALIDIEAIYETKASTANLNREQNPGEDNRQQRIPVYCLLNLQGPLTAPMIQPDIELPTAEPETRSLLETSIGTEEDLMRQFISLLVINSFISSSDNPTGSDNSGIFDSNAAAAGVATASELLSNQLTNWLSQISSDFDIGINYRPGYDEYTADEVEVALSTQLLNDRIIFSGNLDVLSEEVQTNSAGDASNIVGDFDLEFRVTDNVSVKAFNRVNDDRLIRDEIYTQGIGVLYRSEFNSLKELFQNEKKRESQEEEKGKGDAAIRDEELE